MTVWSSTRPLLSDRPVLQQVLQPPHRRVRRLPGEPLPLHRRDHRRHPSQAGAVSHLGPHLRRRDDRRARLPHAGGRPGDRPPPGGPGHRLHQHFQWQLLERNANCEPFSYTPGWKKHVAKAFKEALSIPVIATNTIKDPDFAESLLEEGVSDFVALGRSQFADPEFMNKARPASRRASVSASAACTAGSGCWATPCRWSAP